jgi:hypothetical protein
LVDKTEARRSANIECRASVMSFTQLPEFAANILAELKWIVRNGRYELPFKTTVIDDRGVNGWYIVDAG